VNRWSLGTLIGLPMLGLLLVILIGLTVWMFILWRGERRKRGGYNEAGAALTLFLLGILAIVSTLGGTAWGMWPYDSEYHQWRETSGTVEAIDSRLVGANKSTTERFVVTFDGGRQRACDDTRCAQVHEGDHLTLICKRAWQWAGEHGYDCNYVAHRPA